jgi:hypothetical protein
MLLSGCSVFDGLAACAGISYSAVTVPIRDTFSRPQALGATVILHDGSYQESDTSIVDSLTVRAAEDRGGRTYDIHVTKPYYNDVWVRGVRAPGGGCVQSAPTPATVPVVMSLAPNAPTVRSIHLIPVHILLDRPPYRSAFAFTPVVDASPGTSQAVTWRLAGDTASVTFDPASGALTYRCLPKSGYLTIMAASVANPSVTANGDIAVQGHPAATSDPPC